MPLTAIKKCPNGKYRIGNGECIYDSRQSAFNAYEHWIRDLAGKELKEKIKQINEKKSSK